MHSSTSSSDAGRRHGTAVAAAPVPPPRPEVIEDPPYIRPVPEINFGVAGAVAVVVFLLAFGAWEFYWRSQGVQPTYRNTEGLWAIQRRRINNGEGNATVLAGSSRTLSNIPLQVWERLDGKRPIQLALEGTSPVRVLEGLAEDPDFTGRVIVGVTPILFFTGFEYRKDVLDYYPQETPSQRFGQALSMRVLDPYFAFYDPDFALFTILKRQNWPERAGVPKNSDVRRLFLVERDRNMRLWAKLETDREYQQLAKEIWAESWRTPPDPEQVKQMPQVIEKQIERAAAAVKKLKQRGVDVVFVLHPADGEFLEFESKALPRAATWERLLQRSEARGIHFQDYPELQGLYLPEWSHLAAKDAEVYAERLYRIIQEKH